MKLFINLFISLCSIFTNNYTTGFDLFSRYPYLKIYRRFCYSEIIFYKCLEPKFVIFLMKSFINPFIVRPINCSS